MQIFSKELLMAAGDLHGMYEWTTPGTYSFKLSQRTKATIYIVGGGGIRTYMSGFGYGAGGSGAGFVGGVILPAGVYSVTVGQYVSYDMNSGATVRTNSSLSHNTVGELIVAESAGSYTGNITQHYPWYAGKLSKSSNLQIQQGTVTVESDGYNNNGNSGGASLYSGWGKGSDSTADNQTDGYFKIEW